MVRNNSKSGSWCVRCLGLSGGSGGVSDGPGGVSAVSGGPAGPVGSPGGLFGGPWRGLALAGPARPASGARGAPGSLAVYFGRSAESGGAGSGLRI